MPETHRPTFLVIPCGAAKADAPAAARDLYLSGHFRLVLSAALAEAEACDGTVLVLSAEHGLVTLDQVVAPYDAKMGDPGAIDRRPGGIEELAAQAAALGITWEARADVYALLPARYFAALAAALRLDDVFAADVYEDLVGIGEQRHVAVVVRDTETPEEMAA